MRTHVLPGWPETYAPTLMDSAMILILIPLAMAAVITLLAMGPVWFQRSKEQDRALESSGSTPAARSRELPAETERVSH